MNRPQRREFFLSLILLAVIAPLRAIASNQPQEADNPPPATASAQSTSAEPAGLGGLSRPPVENPAALPPAVPEPAIDAEPALLEDAPPEVSSEVDASSTTVTITETKEGEVLFNFQDADIRAVAKAMAQITGYNFMLDPKVKGHMTVISSKPVSKEAAYQIFLTALTAEGYAAAKGPGGVVSVFPESRALQRTELGAGRPGDTAGWVTQVVPIRHGSASQIAALLKPLMEPNAPLSVYLPANTLIITAPASQIRTLLDLVARVDRSNSGEIEVIGLRRASAIDVAQTLNRLPENAIQAENRLLVVPEVRTNSLLVRADNPQRILQLRRLIVKLDVPARDAGKSRVIYLHFADAAKLAEVLRGLLGVARPAEPPATATNASPPASNPSPQAQAPSVGLAPSGTDAMVQADVESNALIISATDAIYNDLRSVIDKLDRPRAQLFVEALIAEVTTTRAAEFGVQWAGATRLKNGAYGGLQNFPLSGAGIVDAAVAPVATFSGAAGLSVGFLGNSITLPDGTQVVGLGGLARALEQDSAINILSTPQLLTLDNSEAKIVVGQTVPFLTGRYAQAASGSGTAINPFQTIDRQDVGLTLKIRPQISEGGMIKLQIYQEVSSLVPPTPGAQDLITNKRSLETIVNVEHGHIIVLGGLIQDTVTERVDAVPLLGRIPLLGELFKYRVRTKNKVNLMIFLRPLIMMRPQDAASLTGDRYEYIRGEEGRTKQDWTPFIPRFEPPVVPNSMVPETVLPPAPPKPAASKEAHP